MASKKTYWRSIEELNNPDLTKQLASKEFPEELPVEDLLGNSKAMEGTSTSRRDFLKLLGFCKAAVTLSTCEQPNIKSIPFLFKLTSFTPYLPILYVFT